MGNGAYDAIVILGGGLMRAGSEFRPTDYEHGDQFGMMGGYMRVIAAATLYRSGASNQFIFTTGRGPHQVPLYGEDLPTEASVYAAEFLGNVGRTAKGGRITLEDRSVSTLTNIKEVLTIIHDEGYRHVAIVSSDYHIPRVKALYQQALAANLEVECDIDFLSAEEVVQAADPSVYDAEILAAYASEEGQKRLKNEAQGLEDIRSGKYAAATEVRIG